MTCIDQGKKIALAAAEWLGTPHINGAKVKGKGVDCGMLLIACTEDAGLLKKDSIKVPTYSPEWHLHHSEEWMKSYLEKYCEKVTEEELQQGDFLLYQYGRCCSHAGVYVGANAVIHALIDQGVVAAPYNDVMFMDKKGRSRLRGIYRYKGDGKT